MKLGRRVFLKTISFSVLAFTFPQNNANSNEVLYYDNDFVYPQTLKVGSKVAFTAPASPSNSWEIRYFADYLKRRGCSIVYGDTITKRDKKYRYLSNEDNLRAEEINRYFSDPSVDAIICARGGYGSIRILDLIDYDLIKQNPKIFIGFSDITVLLNAITHKTKLITLHGPTGNFFLDSFTTKILDFLLFGSKENIQNVINYKFSKNDVLVEGKAKGRLVGGNLSNLVSLLGTRYDFDTNGKILFFEEVSEHPYKIDRMLMQLELADKFKNCAGVIVGYFGKLDSRRNFYPDYSFTLREILQRAFNKYNFPVIINFPFGHSNKFFTFPIGGLANFDTSRQEFFVNLYGNINQLENMFDK